MPSERVQRRIDSLLDEAEAAVASTDWALVRQRCEAVLALDPENEDARVYLLAAERADANRAAAPQSTPVTQGTETFANGRYEVLKFLGEGGRKKVYLARDTLLDRQVAFALIKTDGLDETARERITREAQTMGRLGTHPNVVAVFDMGEHEGQPFVVIELLGGGDVEGLLAKAEGTLPLERTLQIAADVCKGLEFIHAKGVVHRDLKPGNVWLTAEGSAKIGDYGLAIAADRTRLTLQGTMVGTVDYMPPEQALGGEITPRSDLYSLGALLYELVTGRPPFSGERIAEVIGQHINVVPAPASERGAQIPAALDELISQLLAKDPERRPASAAEVRQRLEAIDPSDTRSDFDENFRLRRARQVFVGRSRELDELRRRFDEAASGQSRIVMLVGQPGIGKTRLAQELEAHARSRRARVLWGRAPEGGGAPEYWLFTQALRRLLDEVDEGTARRVLGEEASQLARIAPDVRERLHTAEPPDPSEFALFEAVRAFLHRLAEDRPLLLVLDDLHWADRGSLGLLQHVSRELATAKALILGTYRDSELSRAHPLSHALATLNREANFFRINVRGLDREQVADYVERSAGFEPTREQLEAFMRETDGNPFFLSEIVAGMLEQGTLNERTYVITIPDSLREALAQRVNALSDDAVELLRLAAVAGYEFDFDTLRVVSQQPEETALELIEEALRDNVIAEAGKPGSYRFIYQPMQRLLLDELSATRRARLHGQIGELLEASYAAQAEQYADALAGHFTESAAINPSHREKALRYAWLAGEQAEAAGELGSAVHWYERCLEFTSEDHRTVGVSKAAALAGVGRVLAAATGSQRALDAIRDAVSLLASQGEGLAAARTALSLRRMADPQGAAAVLDVALDALSARDQPLEARLLAHRALLRRSAGEDDARRAREIADEHNLVDVLARLKQRDGLLAADEGDHVRAMRLTAEAMREAEAAGDPIQPSVAIGMRAGDLDGVLRLSESGPKSISRASRAAVLLLRRDPGFEEFARSPAPDSSAIDLLVLPLFLEAVGDCARALRMTERVAQSSDGWIGGDRTGAAAALRFAFRAGELERARLWLERVRPDLDASLPWARASVAGWSDEALLTVLDREELERLADQRWETEDGVPLVTAGMFGSFDRTRAMWALALDRLDEAERLARRGLEWCERERCPVEAGRCHQLLADVLRRKGDTAEARRHLDAASTLFQRYDARLYLEQVLEQRDFLKA